MAIVAILASVQLYSQGVVFEEMNYDKIIEKARGEHKFVFVDVYADWCSPCKKMDETTFQDTELGTYMKEHFVSYKANYKTPTGNMIAKKYGVSSFPTFLFIDVNGQLVYKAKGYMEANRFKKEAQVASNPGVYNKYNLFKKKFNAGNRDKELLKDYLILGAERYKEADEKVFSAYYKSLDLMDKQEDEVLKTIASYVPYVDASAYALSLDYYMNLPEGHPRKQKVSDNLNAAIERSIQKECKKEPGDELDALQDARRKLSGYEQPTDTVGNERAVDMVQIDYLECGEHWLEYVEAAYAFNQKYLFSAERFHADTTIEKSLAQGVQDMNDAELLARFASTIETNMEDEKAISRGLEWINRAIIWNDKPEYQAIKAYLVKKAGDLNEAVNIARRALEKARKNKSSYAKEMENVLMTIVDGKRNKGISR